MMKRRIFMGAVAAMALLGTGCGSTSAAAAPESTTTTVAADHDAHGDHPDTLSSESETLRCAMHMPGDLLSAEDAVVSFDAQHVCLGYVTVTTQTPVKWRNDDSSPQEVELLSEDGTVIETIPVGVGETIEWTFDTAGIYRFTYSAIPDFTGTVEVQIPA